MGKKGYHVVPRDGDWAVQKEGATRASETFDTKNEAIERGKELAQGRETSLRIHKKDGKIQEERSYGNESPRPG